MEQNSFTDSNDIYIPHGTALGDVICTINIYLRYSLKNKENIRLCPRYIKNNKTREAEPLVRQVIEVIDSKGIIKITNENGTKKPHWTEGNSVEFFPTKIQWAKKMTNKICYQFDGKSHKKKNFKPEEEELIFKHFEKEGILLQRLGYPMKLEECLRIASECSCFIGVDSGMAHLLHGSNIPIFIARNGWTLEEQKRFRQNKQFAICDNAIDLINKVNTYLKDKYYYLEIMENKDKFTGF